MSSFRDLQLVSRVEELEETVRKLCTENMLLCDSVSRDSEIFSRVEVLEAATLNLPVALNVVEASEVPVIQGYWWNLNTRVPVEQMQLAQQC